MHTLARHIRLNNNADLSVFISLIIGGRKMGYVHPDTAQALKDCPALLRDGGVLKLKHDETIELRNKDLKTILKALIDKNLVSHERFELYAVTQNFGDEPLALADRALMPVLGLAATGIHCNGYVRAENQRAPSVVREPSGERDAVAVAGSEHSERTAEQSHLNKRGRMAQNIKIWVGRRSTKILIEPGKLDHIVAGGQPYGLTLRENLAKEAREEAGIPENLVKNAVAAGTIRYARAEGKTVRRDTLFLFDLELPPDFTPINQDGEASGFELMSVEKIRSLMETTDDFKFNVPLVLIDFYIRHGLIDANEPGYAALAQGLR